jgi:sugar/nucleoside kinase (ribokinase family)
VGEGAFGDRLVEGLRIEGVDVSSMQRVRGTSTGTGLIVVDQAGENTIVVNSGADAALSLDGVGLFAPDAALCQLEVLAGVVAGAARRARGVFCLSASPMAALPERLLRRSDLVIVNQSEYKATARPWVRWIGETRGWKGAHTRCRRRGSRRRAWHRPGGGACGGGRTLRRTHPVPVGPAARRGQRAGPVSDLRPSRPQVRVVTDIDRDGLPELVVKRLAKGGRAA